MVSERYMSYILAAAVGTHHDLKFSTQKENYTCLCLTGIYCIIRNVRYYAIVFFMRKARKALERDYPTMLSIALSVSTPFRCNVTRVLYTTE
jgi:hypothetical protein